MKDELWMHKLKERLEDYSEPLPASGWERLEKDLSATTPPMTRTRHMVVFRRWAMVTAAILLLAVSSVSIWLLQSQMGEEIRSTSISSLAVVPDCLPQQQIPAVQTEAIEPLRHAQGKSSRTNIPSLIAQQKNADDVLQKEEERMPNLEIPVQEDLHKKEESPKEEIAVQKDNNEQQLERRRPSGRDKLHLPVEKKSTSKTRRWSVGLAINTGGLSSGGNLDELDYAQNAPVPGGLGGKVDLSAMVNGIVNVPEGQELIFMNGMPYLQKRGDQIASIDHKQPLSFGFSLRKELAKGFSVETGLTYTYLASDVRFVGSSDKVDQKLHYLGIPLRANWNFIDKKTFTMYVSTGGAMEKCIYGKIGSKNETVKPLQFSLIGAVGAQYNVSNRVGLYLEPGVSYFFDDGAQVETIRKENPFNFTLQAGIRLTY